VYLYRAVDKFGDTIDFMLSEKRDQAAATTAFFKQAIDNNGFPKKVVMDKSGANYAGLENINILLGSVNISGIVIQKQPVIDTWKNHN
jgi:putative transposase